MNKEIIKDNFAAIRLLSKVACLLNYEKKEICVFEFLKFVYWNG